MINLLSWTGSSRYNGFCLLFSVFGLSLNLWNGCDLISRLYVGPVRTGHSFFSHLNTSMSQLRGRKNLLGLFYLSR